MSIESLFNKFENHPVLGVLLMWTLGALISLLFLVVAVLVVLYLLSLFGVI